MFCYFWFLFFRWYLQFRLTLAKMAIWQAAANKITEKNAFDKHRLSTRSYVIFTILSAISKHFTAEKELNCQQKGCEKWTILTWKLLTFQNILIMLVKRHILITMYRDFFVRKKVGSLHQVNIKIQFKKSSHGKFFKHRAWF